MVNKFIITYKDKMFRDIGGIFMKKAIISVICICIGAMLAHYVTNKQDAKGEAPDNKPSVEQSVNE